MEKRNVALIPAYEPEKQMVELLEKLWNAGVETAYNLDGGGSSTMVFNGEVVNQPTTSGKSTKERSVSDIVYIGY